ncbi:MAG: lipopolysaccharide biosynthesis protein [Sphingopyxis sp.]
MTEADASDSADSANRGPAEDLSGQVRQAIFWRTGTQIVSQAISWTATLIVIRILNPADYGLFAMAAVMMTFLDFLNGHGFASALIQKKEVSAHSIRQALGLTIVMNSGMAALQFAMAPVVAAYYGKSEVADLLHVLAFIYLMTPFIIVSEALLSRGLDFKKLAIVNLSAAIVGASVSLGCALLGLGVWTLVYAPMALFATRAIGLTIAAKLFILPSFNFRGSGSTLKFGLAMMGSHLFWVIQSQSDIFIAGRRFDAHDVGLYAEALFLTQLVMAKFVPAINQVAFPAYARLQDQPDTMRWSFLSAVRLIMLVTAPIFIGIAASAGPLVETLFGAKWLGMVPLMQILGLAMPLMTLQILFAPMNNALGRPDISMRASAVGALCFALAFLVGSQFGTMGLALAWLIAAPLLLIATILLPGRLTGIGLGDVIVAAGPALLCALAMGGVVWALDWRLAPHLAAHWHWLLLIAVGGTTYLALSWWFQRETLLRMLALVRRQ